MLDCTADQRRVLGLTGSGSAFTPTESQKLSDMWIEFLMKEADQPLDRR